MPCCFFLGFRPGRRTPVFRGHRSLPHRISQKASPFPRCSRENEKRNLLRSERTTNNSSWDVAAGSIIIEEAGGRITDLEGERWNLRTRKICASVGGKVRGEILEVLREAGVVYASPDVDITEQVIEALNKAAPSKR